VGEAFSSEGVCVGVSMSFYVRVPHVQMKKKDQHGHPLSHAYKGKFTAGASLEHQANLSDQNMR